MASVFTYDPNPPRVSSPWSTPESTTPKLNISDLRSLSTSQLEQATPFAPQILSLEDVGITKLEPEPQEGPTEYKLHLLLRPRTSAAALIGVAALYSHDESRSSLRNRSPQLGAVSGSASPVLKPMSTPSLHTRQNRLQHLTTQLLWRLQQSSPFHSSSSNNLVLPLLPEATPRLGVPNKPAQLLPGLEESQGALYEIGVADDGTFVGLTEDELEESLTNLRAMAASLGCRVEVLRRVLVGHYQSTNEAGSGADPEDTLWVTEALVRPDLDGNAKLSPNHTGLRLDSARANASIPKDVHQSEVEQIRISLIGASTSGKSSLLGVLTSSSLDNGRGKSRLSLLKHRHEISSGITSSVAQELVGYRKPSQDNMPDIVNYGLANVASWNDIHSITADGRLAFLSDSPGLPRYSKSTIRTLISWKPHWVVFCVSAVAMTDYVDPNTSALGIHTTASSVATADQSLSYLALCLKLQLPIILTVTKMDMANKTGLRTILSNILSVLKAAGRKPIILPSSASNAPPASHLSAQIGEDAAQIAEDSEAFLQYLHQQDVKDISNVVNSIKNDKDASIVPIVLASSVTGMGIGKLHALLKSLPILNPVTEATDGESTGKTLFHVDEIFAMPISRVYSPGGPIDNTNQGVVLCGHMASGNISIGDELVLGPFGAVDDVSSLIHDRKNHTHDSNALPDSMQTWISVKVMSIRNLRLPVRSLLSGQVGTLGVEPMSRGEPARISFHQQLPILSKARRGMVLTASSPDEDLPAVQTTFSANFSLRDFEDPASPPLIMGGQALVYINSIRAPVKVVGVERFHEVDDGESLASSLATLDIKNGHQAQKQTAYDDDDGMFGFDVDDDEEEEQNEAQKHEQTNDPTEAEVKIEFAFLRWPECFAKGDRILVIPSTAPSLGTTSIPNTSLPLAGGAATSIEKTGSAEFPSFMGSGSNGLSGFVGRVV